MSDPYETMGLARNAGETEIRHRYLELVRQHPPDRDPERFAAIHQAYEALRDPSRRLFDQLFAIETKNDSFEVITADLRERLRRARVPVQTLLSLADSR